MRNQKLPIIFIMTVSLVLSACNRSATDAPATEISSGEQMKSILGTVATQTAQAAQGIFQPESGGGANLETEEAIGLTQQASQNQVATATSTVTPEVQATIQVNLPETYNLKKGEFPFCISRRYNIDIDDLLAANNLSKTQLYERGLKLSIPENADPFNGERSLLNHPTEYTVKAGDTFFVIACSFGDVHPIHIAQANGKTLKDAVTPGEVIQIP